MEKLNIRHLDKIPLAQYTVIAENFHECVSRMTKLAPFDSTVAVFVASWQDSHGIVIMDYFMKESTLNCIFSGITCPYLWIRQNFFLSGGAEVFGIQPSFQKVSVGCPIYHGPDPSLVQGTLSFFVRNRISRRIYAVTCAHTIIYEHVIDSETRKYKLTTEGQVTSPNTVYHPSLLQYEQKKIYLSRIIGSRNPFKKIFAKRKLKEMMSKDHAFLGINRKAFLGAWLDKADNMKKLIDLSIIDIDQDRVDFPNSYYYDVCDIEKVPFSKYFNFPKLTMGSFDDLFVDEYFAVAGSQMEPSFKPRIVQEGKMSCTWFPESIEPLYCGVIRANEGCASYSGDSGACLFNSAGKILGIIFASSIGEQPMSFFMDIDSIRAFLGTDYEFI